MENFIERIRKGFWQLKQPITKKPKNNGEVISDLFVWRNSKIWQTHFELMDITGLFDIVHSTEKKFVEIFFFEADGTLIQNQRVEVYKNKRRTLDLSQFVVQAKSEYGTFCVFHLETPHQVAELGSFITERGYVGYNFENTNLRSYVHGNFDAVSFNSRSISLLGGRSIFTREYSLQYSLTGPALYEFGLVNCTQHRRKVTCKFYSQESMNLIDAQTVTINPGGIKIYAFNVSEAESARVVIESCLVMSRPLVFRTSKNRMDVFHG